MDNTGQNARGNEPLVRFVCRFCGHKVRVAAIHAGKKAKCPRCRNVLVIPSLHGDAPSGSDAPVRLRRDLDGRPFTPPQQGDRPQEMPLRLQTMPEPLLPAEPDVAANISGSDSSAVESQEQSKLPWVIDIFAYPASIGGLMHFAFFSVAPLLLLLISATVGRMCCYGRFLALASYVVVAGYVLYYFSECAIESARGQRRAPDMLFGDPPTAAELAGKFGHLLACLLFCFLPLIAYGAFFLWSRLRQVPMQQWDMDEVRLAPVFVSLYLLGLFLLPMTMLATVMFDSISALSPLLIIGSIISTFLPYCGLVLLFMAIGYLFNLFEAETIAARLLLWVAQVYAMFIAFHLLGRFYRRYEEKLNWEVKL